MNTRYVHRNKIVEAIQFHPGEHRGELAYDVTAGRVFYREDGTAEVRSEFTTAIALAGDWIVREHGGNLRVVGKKAFAMLYEPIDR